MDDFIATMVRFAAPFAPRGYMDCDGRLLPIAQFQALFALIGTEYGGDGRTTFALPDLRDRDRHGRPVPFGGNGRPRWIICTEGIFPQRP